MTRPNPRQVNLADYPEMQAKIQQLISQDKAKLVYLQMKQAYDERHKDV